MIVALLLLLPLLASAGILFCKGKNIRRILTLLAAGHVVLTCLGGYYRQGGLSIGTLRLGFDIYDPAFYVLGITSFLFFFVVVYLRSWLPAEEEYARIRKEGKGMSIKTFSAILPLFLATMTLTALSRDFGMLWVAVEATTLASAPLINYHKTKSSLEAMWKYLLLCSLGIGLALFGTMLLSASLAPGSSLSFTGMSVVNVFFFNVAFVFCFAGYALKCGLAPFHCWLPDAHSEAPAPVSALLSGSLLNCAILGIWRIRDVAPQGTLDFCNDFFIFFGVLSLIVAAIFIIGQKDFKRMLAYSSVEHMGLIAMMIGFSTEGTALVHMIFHSFIKLALFLAAGNILLYTGTRKISAVQGLFTSLPRNAKAWMLGMLFICGTPPSPLFFTEWALVTRAGLLYGGLVLFLLFVIFCAMCHIVLKMTMGEPSVAKDPVPVSGAEKAAFVPLFVLYGIIAGILLTAVLLYLATSEKLILF